MTRIAEDGPSVHSNVAWVISRDTLVDDIMAILGPDAAVAWDRAAFAIPEAHDHEWWFIRAFAPIDDVSWPDFALLRTYELWMDAYHGIWDPLERVWYVRVTDVAGWESSHELERRAARGEGGRGLGPDIAA